jgi:hypothetical protein
MWLSSIRTTFLRPYEEIGCPQPLRLFYAIDLSRVERLRAAIRKKLTVIRFEVRSASRMALSLAALFPPFAGRVS